MLNLTNSTKFLIAKPIPITFAVLATAFVLSLFNHGFVPSMEPRMAEVVREMMAAGEWIIPLKNGTPYVEYPVFYYWLAIGAKTIGLPMTAAIRLPTFLAFLGWLVLLGRWQQLAFPNLPKFAFQLLGATAPLALFQFSIAQTDGLLVFGVLLAMYGYTKHVINGRPADFPWSLWLGVAVATLAKGPVGIACTLPIMFLDCAVSATTSRNVRVMFSVCWFRGLALLIAVTMPWYVLAGMSRGWEFVEAVLIYQNFDRYVTGYSHQQPWWYYFKTIIYDFFPLSILLPWGAWVARRHMADPAIRFSLLWAGFTFLFFTLSGSKQGKYLLPMAPAVIALAFVAIMYLRQRTRFNAWRWVRRWSLGLIAIYAGLIALVLPFYSGQIGGVNGFEPIRAQIEKAPGELVHFQWPRSLTLYELGAPMAYVRSSRELYSNIANGDIKPGDYVLVRQSLLGTQADSNAAIRLIPYPSPEIFEFVLEVEIEKPVVLLRVLTGARFVDVPATPEPAVLNWRDAMFDTD